MPLLAQPGAMLVQSGEIMTWKRLKRRERDQESQDEIRAAFNVYTNQLSFDSERYALASQDVRKKLIREDRLPDVKSVITSDMGLRYLYRNEVLGAMDDARSELVYQMGEFGEGKPVDLQDLGVLLQDADSACLKWLGLIEERDVTSAMDFVLNE